MKNHALNIESSSEGIRKVVIPDGYREKIESGDTIDNDYTVVGYSKVNKNTVIVYKGPLPNIVIPVVR